MKNTTSPGTSRTDVLLCDDSKLSRNISVTLITLETLGNTCVISIMVVSPTRGAKCLSSISVKQKRRVLLA